MARGYTLEKGFLFDHNWEKTLRRLDAKDFHTVFWEMYDFQKSKGENAPKTHDNSLVDCILELIMPQIQNRLNGARGGGAPPTPRGTDLREDKIREDKRK